MSKEIKSLIEKRNDYKAQAENLVSTAKAENRAITAEEKAQFDELIDKIEKIDDTINASDRVEKLVERKEVKVDDKETADIKAFANSIRQIVNSEDPTHLTKGDNGALIPTTIVKKIMDKVSEISPLYRLATRYTAKGTLVIPVVDTTTDDITVAFADEFSDLVSHSNKFTSVTLSGFLFGSLTKISKSLINNSDFDLVSFVINRMSNKIALFIDDLLINGAENKVAGVARSYDSTNMKFSLAKKSSVSADELIEIQDMIPDTLQNGACWIMTRATRTAIRQLKDGEGRYLLLPDFSNAGYNYTLLGKPVYISEKAPALGTQNNIAIIYLNPEALAVKEPTGLEMQVLNEHFATQHAVGVVAWGEIDSKVENLQGVVCAVCGANDN